MSARTTKRPAAVRTWAWLALAMVGVASQVMDGFSVKYAITVGTAIVCSTVWAAADYVTERTQPTQYEIRFAAPPETKP